VSAVQIFWAILIAIALLSIFKILQGSDNPLKGFIRIEDVDEDDERSDKKK